MAHIFFTALKYPDLFDSIFWHMVLLILTFSFSWTNLMISTVVLKNRSSVKIWKFSIAYLKFIFPSEFLWSFNTSLTIRIEKKCRSIIQVLDFIKFCKIVHCKGEFTNLPWSFASMRGTRITGSRTCGNLIRQMTKKGREKGTCLKGGGPLYNALLVNSSFKKFLLKSLPLSYTSLPLGKISTYHGFPICLK